MAGCTEIEHDNVAFDISPDGKSIAFSSAEGDLYLLDLGNRGVRRITETPEIETAPAFSPDGLGIAYAASLKDAPERHIFYKKLDRPQAQQMMKDAGVADANPAFSRDGARIAFARAHRHRPYSMGGWTWDDWDVCVMDADGKNLTRLTHNNYYGIGGVTFSSDGKIIYFSADRNRAASELYSVVFEVPVDGSAAPQAFGQLPASIGKCGAWSSEPELSPDGKAMVFISDRGSPYQYDLYLQETDANRARALSATSVSRYNSNPRFTPDGSHILFLAGTESNAGNRPIFSLWSIDVDGKNAKEIADSQLFTEPLKWKPKK